MKIVHNRRDLSDTKVLHQTTICQFFKEFQIALYFQTCETASILLIQEKRELLSLCLKFTNLLLKLVH